MVLPLLHASHAKESLLACVIFAFLVKANVGNLSGTATTLNLAKSGARFLNPFLIVLET